MPHAGPTPFRFSSFIDKDSLWIFANSAISSRSTKKGHVGRAAERLALSQPALSLLQIRQLERDLVAVPGAAANACCRPSPPTPCTTMRYRCWRDWKRPARRCAHRPQADPRSLAISVLQTVNASLVPYMVERLHAAQPHPAGADLRIVGIDIEQRLLTGNLDISISFLPPRRPAAQRRAVRGQYAGDPRGTPVEEFRKNCPGAWSCRCCCSAEFRARQIWQEQLAAIGRRPRVQAELNRMSRILDSLPQTRFATVLPGKARQMHSNHAGCCGNRSANRASRRRSAWSTATRNASTPASGCCARCWKNVVWRRGFPRAIKPRLWAVYADLYPDIVRHHHGDS